MDCAATRPDVVVRPSRMTAGWRYVVAGVGLGFSAPGHFSRFFRDHAGVNPSEFRQVARMGSAAVARRSTSAVSAVETLVSMMAVRACLKPSSTATAGVLKDKGRVWIWYSDDARHIPVQMRARMLWGTLTFKLLSIEQK